MRSVRDSSGAGHVKIAVLPGDGIGKEVTAEAVKVLRAVAANNLSLELREGLIGGEALSTVGDALTNRRDPGTGLAPPVLRALGVSLVPITMLVLATQLPSLQRGMLTQPLTGPQWLLTIGLAVLFILQVSIFGPHQTGNTVMPWTLLLVLSGVCAPALYAHARRQWRGIDWQEVKPAKLDWRR